MARSFKTQKDFRDWLHRNHTKGKELILRCFKVHAKDRGIGYREGLDEALCYGWIDGVRRGVDDDSFTVRFTPRKPRSNWSRVNIRRANELEADGKMHPAGLVAFRARDVTRPAPYSFESKPLELSAAFAKQFRANKAAWEFFQAQAPWYRRVSKFWVMSAKRDETRKKRLRELIDRSAKRVSIEALRRSKSK
jgi:uncharacterized protein YdeI (YjbR/CyaY-like superfamily)